MSTDVVINIEERINTLNNNEVLFLSHKSKEVNAKNILFLGVMHGEEPQGDFLITKFIIQIMNYNLEFKNNLFFIPCLNPDGKSICSRGNANNVDLNRNFPTKNYEVTTFDDGTTSGASKSSELETKFLVNIIEKYKFDAILSIHAPFEIVNFDGDALDIANDISKITSYPVQADIGYPTPGSFGTYCGIERNIPTITLEVSKNLSDDELWEQNKDVFTYLANL
ncbi:MAG: DUF2817 domain-containing protein [Candidatus Gastranaerophilales bacterium]|nr:DUF2817 domain-containing protein [Candidatus Gastranaerophilales bacterium]